MSFLGQESADSPPNSLHFGINMIRGSCLDPLEEASLPVRYFNHVLYFAGVVFMTVLPWSINSFMTRSTFVTLLNICQTNISSIINSTF